MFSILVCSVNNSYLERLKINLRETTGNEYELLVWDNGADPRPITEVYNLLATRAKYPFWCFIHEDIEFITNNWSENLRTAFEQHPETGLIGIAGAKYKSRTPSGWSTGLPALDYCNIYHQNPKGETEHLYNNPGKSNFVSVMNTDGVFMAVRRELWADTRFNEKILRGFHFYDIDFSYHAVKKWKAAVIFNIDIMHFTVGGNFGDEWIKYSLQWHREFSKYLPQTEEGFIKSRALENKIRRNWLYRLHSENISMGSKWRWIKAGKAWQDPRAWPYILLFLIGKRKPNGDVKM